jgi:membrane protease YdiL (CAAX protease family)
MTASASAETADSAPDDRTNQIPPRRAGLRSTNIVGFLGLTFAISWSIWVAMSLTGLGIGSAGGAILNVIAMAGPSITALALTVASGREQLRRLAAGFDVARASLRWSIVALLLPLILVAIAIVLATGMAGSALPSIRLGLLGVLAAEFVRILLVGGPLEEEIGWRGYALPRLLDKCSPRTASILLGIVWGFWHVPLYFVAGTGQAATLAGGMSAAFAIGGFVGWTIGLSILFTWLFIRTRGSLIVVILFHASVDLAAFVPAAVGAPGMTSLLNVGLTCLAAAAIVRMLRRSPWPNALVRPSHNTSGAAT